MFQHDTSDTARPIQTAFTQLDCDQENGKEDFKDNDNPMIDWSTYRLVVTRRRWEVPIAWGSCVTKLTNMMMASPMLEIALTKGKTVKKSN